jgi:hypothetical protein
VGGSFRGEIVEYFLVILEERFHPNVKITIDNLQVGPERISSQ